jgi:hypothetical protein
LGPHHDPDPGDHANHTTWTAHTTPHFIYRYLISAPAAIRFVPSTPSDQQAGDQQTRGYQNAHSVTRRRGLSSL